MTIMKRRSHRHQVNHKVMELIYVILYHYQYIFKCSCGCITLCSIYVQNISKVGGRIKVKLLLSLWSHSDETWIARKFS